MCVSCHTDQTCRRCLTILGNHLVNSEIKSVKTVVATFYAKKAAVAAFYKEMAVVAIISIVHLIPNIVNHRSYNAGTTSTT